MFTRQNFTVSTRQNLSDKGQNFMPRFWSALDDLVFGLKNAEVYSYAPPNGGGDDDPLGFLTQSLASGNEGAAPNRGCLLFPTEDNVMDGLTNSASDFPHRILTSPMTKSEDTAQVTLWTMNYFFVSGNKKRIILFACVQTMRSPQGGDDLEEEGDEYQYGENELVFDEARRSKTQEEKDHGYELYPLVDTRGGDDSNMADEANYEVDVDIDEDDEAGDEDQEETDFDTGALKVSA